MVALASVVVAVIVITALISFGRARGLHGLGPVTPGQASAAPDLLAAEAFKCSTSIGLGVSGAPQVTYIDAVRTDARRGYERLTIEFANGRPRDVLLTAQQGSTFAAEGSGKSFVLRGRAGALITIHGADGHTRYKGQSDIKTSYAGVLEVREILDAQGTVQWAVGLSNVACYRATFYENPARLIVDFQIATSG